MTDSITVGIASVPARKENLLKTLASLAGQADRIVVALNNYTEVPQELSKFPNVEPYLLDNSLKDSAKFLRASECNGWYVSWDDDILPPPDVVQVLIAGATKYNGLVSLHGKKYLPPVTNFKRWAGNYRCLNSVSEDVKVNVIGSGCACFHTDRLKVHISDFKTPGKADVWLSKVASDQGVPMVVLAHKAGYIEYLGAPKGTTIWETTHDYSEHVRIMRTFIK
jgi:hypothetical protein